MNHHKERQINNNLREARPLVSLVITSYNRAPLIRDAIESALTQDYPNLEIIISDNCSTDGTDAIIEEYLEDGRIRYSRNEANIGMLPNFFKATTQLARGKFITFLSSDDYLVNDSFISEAVRRFDSMPNLVLVHSINLAKDMATDKIYTDSSYAYYRDTFYKEDFVLGRRVFLDFPQSHSISFGGTLIDRAKLMAIRLFEGNVFSFDVQATLQLVQIGDVSFIDKETYVSRRHSGSLTCTVSKATTYIENLDYIDVPYRFALEINHYDKTNLDRWRLNMQINYCTQCLRNLYMRSPAEYSLFEDYLVHSLPLVHSAIVSRIGWKIRRFMAAAPPLQTLFEKVIGYARFLRDILRANSSQYVDPPRRGRR